MSEQFAFGPSLKDLGDKYSAGFKYLFGNCKRRLGQRHDPQMIGSRMPGSRRRHVTQDDIRAAAKRVLDHVDGAWFGQIGPQNRRTRDRRGLGEIDPNHAASRSDARDSDLRPAARRAAEIDDVAAGSQHMKTVVELDQFKGGTGPITVASGGDDIRIIELSLQPLRR